MPVRSLNSSVFKWPDAKTVDQAVHRWARDILQQRGDIRGIGYFGSYARGNWGVGSDLDLLVILDRSEVPFERRALEWNTLELPVPADLLVYTRKEWEALAEAETRFYRTVNAEAVWVFRR